MTSPIGEDDLAAWIDGRLSPERQRLVDAYLEGQPDVHARLREQAEQARALASLFAPIAEEPIPATMRVAAIRGTATPTALATRHRRVASAGGRIWRWLVERAVERRTPRGHRGAGQ
ncbi:hypothetical protein QP150_20330 [Sphingomonas sp. 22L2VL55-3]